MRNFSIRILYSTIFVSSRGWFISTYFQSRKYYHDMDIPAATMAPTLVEITTVLEVITDMEKEKDANFVVVVVVDIQ